MKGGGGVRGGSKYRLGEQWTLAGRKRVDRNGLQESHLKVIERIASFFI
jgi:hypothetical protein